MSEDKKSKFKWDPECLKRDEFEIDLGAADPAGTPFIIYELARGPLLEFVETCIDKNFLKEDGERRPFAEIEKEQVEVLSKVFSESTKTPSLLQAGDYKHKKDPNYRAPEFFAKLDIPARAFGDLIEAFFAVQHLEEILATGGNWLMLPTVRQVQKQTEADDAEK